MTGLGPEGCKNPKASRCQYNWICLCSDDIQSTLTRGFINGWISPESHRYYAEEAAVATPERLQELLFKAEEEASHAYGMWANYQ